MAKEEGKSKKEKWRVTEIATQTQPVIMDDEDNQLDVVQALKEILNNQEILKKLVD